MTVYWTSSGVHIHCNSHYR